MVRQEGRLDRGARTEADYGPAEKTYCPMFSMVAVQQIAAYGSTPGGVVLPDSAADQTGYMPVPTYRVIAVGPEVEYLRVGDEVILGKAMMAIVHHPTMANETNVIDERFVLGVVNRDLERSPFADRRRG